MRCKHGLGDALSAAAQDLAAQSYPPVITELLEVGKNDGTIRLDADPGDFLQLTEALWRGTTGPRDRAPHMLALILDCLRVLS